MKVVILGANGMVGYDIVKTFNDMDLYPFSHNDADITNKEVLNKKIKNISPDLIINSAAYTDVDGCESNYNRALSVNSIGVKNIAEISEEMGCEILHISTDYVFDGEKQEYKEDDIPNPINAYGKSKYLGEKYLRRIATKYYLVRSSWLYGKHGKNFVRTILNLARTKKEIEVVDDQIGCPTYSRDFAESIHKMINMKTGYGVYHLTNSGRCSWHDFAKKIIKIKNLDVSIKPISSERFIRHAKRPRNSVLVNTKLPLLRGWGEALEEYISENE